MVDETYMLARRQGPRRRTRRFAADERPGRWGPPADCRRL